MNAADHALGSRPRSSVRGEGGGFVAIIAGGLVGGLLASPQMSAASPADVAVQATAVHRDWSVVRVGDGDCLATQQVHGRRTGALLVEAVLSQPVAVGARVVLALRVPNGVHLPDGIAYRHAASDAVAVGFEWQQCTALRCTAVASISDIEFGRLLRGRQIVVGYRPLPDARLLNVPVSLLGLTAAWREVSACQRRSAQINRP